MCRDCKMTSTCKKDEMMPIISPLSAYLIRFYNEFEAGFTEYPQSGTWQSQYPWFMSGIETIRITMARLRKEDQEKERRKYGKS